MTAEFKAVSPERAVRIMKAWAYRPWPITFDEGIRIYTSLGMRGESRDAHLFYSDLSDNEPDSSFVSINGFIESCTTQLSNWVPESCWEISLPQSRLHYSAISGAYEELMGPPQSKINKNNAFSARWILDNRITVELGGNEAFIDITVESPTQTRYLLDELEAEANGEEIGADYF